MATSSRPTVQALGLWLVATICVAFVFLGGVSAGVQSVLHLMVAGGAALALALPDRKLALAGATRTWAVSAALLLLALAAGLLPVPRAMAAWVAPGYRTAPADRLLTLATEPSRTSSELASLVLVLGFGTVVVVWGATRHRRNEAEVAIVLGTGAVALSAGLHAWLGARAMFGLIAPETLAAPAAFFAPFVNPNHAASVMVLGGPVAIGVMLDPEQGGPRRMVSALVGAGALVILVSSGSAGAGLAALAVAFVWVLRSRGLPLSALGVVVALVLTVQVWASATWGLSAGATGARAVLWGDSLRMLGDFWLAGTGGGTFGEAIRPYRTDRAFLAFDHAHNDPLEWLVETGALGAVAGLLAFGLLWRGATVPRRADGLVFGLLGLLLHSLVEFPLQMPAIAMSAAAMAAFLVAVFTPRVEASPRGVRLIVLLVGLLQLPAAWRQAREAVVQQALEDVDSYAEDPERAAAGAYALSLAGAGEPERLLFDAWSAERRLDPEAAVAAASAVGERFPDAPDAVREAAIVLARAEDYAGATALLQGVTARDPSDYRAWVILARVALAQGDRQLAQQRWSEAFHRDAPPRLIVEAFATMPSGLIWLESFSDAPPVYSVTLGFLLFRNRQYDEALLACDQAAAIDPVYADLLIRGRLLVAVGRPEEAERWIDDVLSRRPDELDYLLERGEIQSSIGRHKEATASFLEAARVNPAARVRALSSAESEGGPQRALEVVRQFELEGTVDPVLRLRIAAVRMRSGDYAGCSDEIERWNLTAILDGPEAAELLETCRSLSRTGGR